MKLGKILRSSLRLNVSDKIGSTKGTGGELLLEFVNSTFNYISPPKR